MGNLFKLGTLVFLLVVGVTAYLFFNGQLDGLYYDHLLSKVEGLSYEKIEKDAADLEPQEAGEAVASHAGERVIWKGQVQSIREPGHNVSVLVVKGRDEALFAVIHRADAVDVDTDDWIEVAGELADPLRPVTVGSDVKLPVVLAAEVRKLELSETLWEKGKDVFKDWMEKEL